MGTNVYTNTVDMAMPDEETTVRYAAVQEKDGTVRVTQFEQLKKGDRFRLYYISDDERVDDFVYVARCDAWRKGNDWVVTTIAEEEIGADDEGEIATSHGHSSI